MPTPRAVRTAALVALLLVVLPAAAAPADSTEPQPAPSPAMLTLEPTRSSDFVTPSIDVSTSIEIEHRQAAAHLERRSLARQVKRADDEETEQRILFLAATDTKRAASDLRAEERAARRAYRNGSITAEAYTRRIVVNTASAAQLRRTMTHIGDLAARVPGITVRQRILETRLIGLEGPVRTRLLAALDGSGSVDRVQIIASRNGTVLSTFGVRGTFLHEAYRADRWTRTDVGETDLPGIVDVVRSTYPDAYNHSTSTSFTGGLGRGIYQANLQLPDGELEAHLDADTESVFYEVWRSHPAAVTNDAAVMTEGTTVRVVVNRSVPSGPLRVATVDRRSGSPLDRPVVVNGRGYRTGDDGVLWTLTPDRPQFTVRVATDDGPVTVTVRPILQERTGGGSGTDEGAQPT